MKSGKLQKQCHPPKAQRKRAMALGDSHPAPKPAEAHVGFIKVIFHRSDQLDPPSASKTKKFFDRDGSGIPHPQALHFDDGEKKAFIPR